MLRPTLLLTVVLALPLSDLFFAGNASAADIDFAKQVQPIFKKHCSGCHGKKKGMGKLRLHTPEAIQKKWDKDEHLIVRGNPDESELYERLLLPADHKKFMPKKGKPLGAEKLLLIHQWIEQGAVFPVTASAKPQATAETAAAEQHDDDHAKKPAAKPKKVPLPEVGAADATALEKLRSVGAQVTSIYSGSSLLQVSYALRGEPATDADVALLADVAEQVYSLNLAKAQLTDKGLAVLSRLKNLSQLHLENSSVEDSGLSHLSGLVSLQYLNLYGTGITDAGLQHLQGLKHLQKLYVWKTKVSYDAAQAMQKAGAGMLVDLGFDHPVIAKQRVTKQLALAKEQVKSSEEDFKKVKEEFDQAKKNQEATKKRLDELQKKMDELEGKAKPGIKEDPKLEEQKPEDQKSKDKVAKVAKVDSNS